MSPLRKRFGWSHLTMNLVPLLGGYQKLKLHSELKFKKGFRLYVISFYEAFNAITLAILLHWNEIIQD